MKKGMTYYLITWSLLLFVFNVIAFAGVSGLFEDGFTASFWLGYLLINACFAGQLVCGLRVFRVKGTTALFYNISLIRASYAGLIVSFVVGAVCMLIPPLPAWIGGIVCAIVVAANAIAVLKAQSAIDVITSVDQRVKTQVLFIKSMTVDAETLQKSAVSDTCRTACRKVYEAFRYSDPMSHDLLANVEHEIIAKFVDLRDAVKADDEQSVPVLAEEILVLIEDRNKKCKLLK